MVHRRGAGGLVDGVLDHNAHSAGLLAQCAAARKSGAAALPLGCTVTQFSRPRAPTADVCSLQTGRGGTIVLSCSSSTVDRREVEIQPAGATSYTTLGMTATTSADPTRTHASAVVPNAGTAKFQACAVDKAYDDRACGPISLTAPSIPLVCLVSPIVTAH
jgi:hypothetical protein